MTQRYEPARISNFARRRETVIERLAARNAAALIPTAQPKARNSDTEHRYRPDSDFWRLTGFGEPHSALVLLPALGARSARTILFLRDNDRDQEIWSGRRLGVSRAAQRLEIDEARPFDKLWTDLPQLIAGYERLCYRTGVDAENDRRVLSTLSQMRSRSRAAAQTPMEILDTAPVLHELRLFKDAAEIDAMRKAAEITAAAHLAAMRSTRPGLNEREIEALIEYEFRRRGANAPAYNTIVAGGANACVLHYVDNDMALADGDLLLIDAGAEFEHYACDVTRTFPVGRRFTDAQRTLYDIVLRAQLAAIEASTPGVAIESVHDAAVRVLAEGLCDVGLVAGDAAACIESGAYKRFYMHRTSHWLGLDVHDCGAYVEAGSSRKLEPGMVLTVEPGLYVAPDENGVDERWRGIGIRIEDDVLVSAEGPQVLTSAIPKSIEALEALRSEHSS